MSDHFKVIKVPANDDTYGPWTDLHEAAFPDCEPWWDAKGDYWFVRDDQDNTVAFAGLLCSKTEGGGFLARSGVLRPWRGQGLQRRLIKAREAHARRRGMHFLVSHTVDNPVSANNLIECGFRIYKPIAPWDEGDGVVFWRKELN